MRSVAVVTDSNSGITQAQAKELGVYVVPMPFYIDGETYFEDISMTQSQFYGYLEKGVEVMSSQPSPETLMELWDKTLEKYDEIVHIPMSSGLSSSCETASMIAQEFDGKVQVVNNQRISVTQKRSVLDAMKMAEDGMNALEIKEYLEKTKFDSSIYITLVTLSYLKKGGRITPAAATLGNLLKIKPVLQIQGEKLDAFAKARTMKQARKMMIDAVRDDLNKRFDSTNGEGCYLDIAYTKDLDQAEDFKKEVVETFTDEGLYINPLSLSIACHIGPGALALTATKKM